VKAIFLLTPVGNKGKTEIIIGIFPLVTSLLHILATMGVQYIILSFLMKIPGSSWQIILEIAPG